MADEKKPDAKPAPAPSADPFVEVVWFLIVLVIVVYLINWLSTLKSVVAFRNGDLDLVTNLENILLEIFGYYKIFIMLVSVFLVWAIFYLYQKVTILRMEEAKKMYVQKPEEVGLTNPKWDKILNNIESLNESDWRLAILEADIMLDTLLDNLRLPGDTIADKLKAVEKSDFTTIDNAWEAHKIRNQVAHEGNSFALSQREAKRVIDLYRTVFEEFRII